MLKKVFFSICRLLPHRIAKTYLLPLRYRRRSIHAYHAKDFFESYYSLADSCRDEHTVSPDAQPHLSRFHYNQVENSIIEFLENHPDALPLNRVLDIGAGTGHWTDFYLKAFQAKHVTAIEISTIAAQRLQEHFPVDRVKVINQSVADAEPLPEKVDLINAIGVMFHVVNDEELDRVVQRLAEVLRPGGVFIISGFFGWISQNTQFHSHDAFSTWAEARDLPGDGPLLVDKRVRSIFFWRRLLNRHHLRIKKLRRYHNSLPGPENNVLFAVRCE